MDGNASTDSQCDVIFNNDEIQYFLYPRSLQIFVPVVIPIISVIGLVCNCTFMYVVAKIPEMQTVVNFYLINLAVSDSITLLCGLIQYLYSYYKSPLNLGFAFETGVGCVLAGVLGYGCYFNSVFIVTLLMFDRYMAVCHPLYHRKITGERRTFKLIASSWLAAFSLSAFAADSSATTSICLQWESNESHKLPNKVYVCTGRTYWAILVLYIIDIIQFFLSCCVCTFFIFNIILTLSRRLSSSSSDKRMTQDRNQIARMLIINATIFFICLGPFQILNFEFAYIYFVGMDLFAEANLPFILSIVGQATTLLNSSINPIVYSITNERYRRAFKEAVSRSKQSSKDDILSPLPRSKNEAKLTTGSNI